MLLFILKFNLFCISFLFVSGTKASVPFRPDLSYPLGNWFFNVKKVILLLMSILSCWRPEGTKLYVLYQYHFHCVPPPRNVETISMEWSVFCINVMYYFLIHVQQGDRDLSDISHIIVDEVPERTVLVHFLTCQGRRSVWYECAFITNDMPDSWRTYRLFHIPA